MNLKDAAEWPLKESLKEQEQQSALQVLEQGWPSIQPELKSGLFKTATEESIIDTRAFKKLLTRLLSRILSQKFSYPPASPEEAKIQLLADLVISLIFPEKKIEPIISKALSEIKKAYNVILRKWWRLVFTRGQESRKEKIGGVRLVPAQSGPSFLPERNISG